MIPSQAQLRAAKSKTVPDVIGPGLKALFCGINPSLYSAAVGRHFARARQQVLENTARRRVRAKAPLPL